MDESALVEGRRALADQIGDYFDIISDGEGGMLVGYHVIADVIQTDGKRTIVPISGDASGEPLPDWIRVGYLAYCLAGDQNEVSWSHFVEEDEDEGRD